MTYIVPLTDLRDTARMIELSETEPVFITKNGRGSRVLMNLDTYDAVKEIVLDIELEQRLQRFEKEGGDVDAHEFLRKFLRWSIMMSLCRQRLREILKPSGCTSMIS